VILVDANLLVYAYVQDLPQHKASREWLDRQLKEVPKVGLPWASLLAFVRLVSNPKIFKNPVPLSAAWQQVEAWLLAPSAWIPGPTSRHATVLGELLSTEGLEANDIPDVHLAALAIEHDLRLYSNDGGYSRFAGLQWQTPLSQVTSKNEQPFRT
jgi:toxin-antitoxin system PIN domain toxin